MNQHPSHIARHGTRRATWFATAAVVALSVSGAAMAQQNAPSQSRQGGQGQNATQTQSGNPLGPQLQAVARSLRQSQEQLAQQGSDAPQPNWEQARRAVSGGQETLGRAPSDLQGQEAFRTARTQLSEAQSALQGDSPDRQRAATQLREAAEAIAALQGRVTSADASGGGTSGASSAASSGAQVSVQQRAPQVTVQQPAPQVSVQQPRPEVTVQQPAPQVTVQQPRPEVTVRQPAPQVTVQQPRPEVTVQQARPEVNVQQAQPQVNVERQGQPQVTVQRQGEPQVNVQRQGEPQVNVQRQGQAQVDVQRQGQSQPATQQNDQRTGATATPAPAQSGGAQRTAASAGVPLQRVSSLIGTNVVGENGRESGEVENLLLDQQGNVRGALIEWGGFLGIGTRRAVVPMERIEMSSQPARLNMTREELEALPRYDEANLGAYGRERGWGEGIRMAR
ncbi:MAG TPA: PRC-barrel domain-containing protein [Falsiroseomonas sp.]|jgi:sporulation protein YlmC with PRC-barrel domain|nr:PRC-barrel domain-containing protein [Falsiroseomonas sp.]